MPLALIALGSNATSSAGSPENTVIEATKHLNDESVRVIRKSRLYHTPAYPKGNGPDFINAAIAVETTLSAQTLLEALHRIEHRFDRIRKERWGPRTLDLDLLDFDRRVIPDRNSYMTWQNLPPSAQRTQTPDQLILPHPRLQERSFVLVPLADIAPDWEHPVLKKNVDEMLAELPEDEKSLITRLETGF